MKKSPHELETFEAYSKARTAILRLYGTDKGRKFIHHLIYAFTAVQPDYIYYSKKELFDCITKLSIRSISTRNEPLEDRALNDEFKSLKSTPEDELEVKQAEFRSHVKDYLVKHPMKRIAFRSKLSNKILGLEEKQALLDFINSQVISNNTTIKKMVNYNKYQHNQKNSTKSKVDLSSHIDSDTLRKLESLR